jgi:hypothetical protein
LTTLGVEESRSAVVARRLRISPSIARGSAEVSFTLARSAAVSCLLYDAAGNTVSRLSQGAMGPGAHRLAIPTERLEPGVYLCRLQAGDASAAARFTVVR